MATSTRRFAVGPAVLFDRLVDAEGYPAWLMGARDVHVRDPQWPEPASSFDHEVGVGPLVVHDSTSVEDVEPQRSLHLVVRARPFLVADVQFDLTPESDGTTLRMTETPRGAFRVLAPLIAPVVRWRNDRSLARLADLLAT